MKLLFQICYALFILATLSIITTGCAIGIGKSLHEYSLLDTTDLKPGQKSRAIEAETDQHVIIATDNTDFSDEAYHKLVNECPRGRIVNITARYSTDLGFFAYKNKMKLTGYCLE